MVSTATETVSQFDVQCEQKNKISQNFQNLVFLQEKMGNPKKTLKFIKIADGNRLAVQCEGLSKVSENVRILGFGRIKEYFAFSRKAEVF